MRTIKNILFNPIQSVVFVLGILSMISMLFIEDHSFEYVQEISEVFTTLEEGREKQFFKLISLSEITLETFK